MRPAGRRHARVRSRPTTPTLGTRAHARVHRGDRGAPVTARTAVGPVRLRPGDNPIFDRDARGGRARGGATLVAAARRSWTGDARPRVQRGGWPASRDAGTASGFCVYDDPAIAIAWMLEPGGRTRSPTWTSTSTTATGRRRSSEDDPRVLTISIHEFAPSSGSSPAPGSSRRTGGAGRPGSALNVPLAPGRPTTPVGSPPSASRCRPPCARSRPEVLVTQLGCDTHVTDPLAHLGSPLARTARRRRRCTSSRTSRRRPVGRDRGRRLPVGARRAARMDDRTFAEMCGVAVPDELPARLAWIERSRSSAAVRRTPVTFSEPPLSAAGRRDRAATAVSAMYAPSLGLRDAPGRTKLVCTLGPATETPEFVRGLVAAGASIFRINFSHGTPEDHERAVALVRTAPRGEEDRALAVLADLPGPKVRLGEVDPDALRFTPGQPVRAPAADGRADDAGDDRRRTPASPDDLREPATASCSPTAPSSCSVAGDRGPVGATEWSARAASFAPGQGVNVPAERLGLPRDHRARPRGARLGRWTSGSTWWRSRSSGRPEDVDRGCAP